MTVSETPIPGLLVIEPKVFGDARGFFCETWNAARYADAGLPTDWVQDNLSRSARHTLRGLHFQTPPHAQAKLVSCLEGAVFDVAVDLRRGSPTFGQWHGVELSADNHRQFFIPAGFAHGFLVTSDTALFAYKVAGGSYAPEHEGGIVWNDPDLAINWPLPEGAAPLVSGKDAVGASMAHWATHASFVYD
ncbi:MAG: dTDP-4-dehydrorhamnose 3,5-epimerase [Bacteroidetes bacterium]|nr:dTDP-4-dehydrorhamnose 3,5-epimerase [Bacteroidota bacterium]